MLDQLAPAASLLLLDLPGHGASANTLACRRLEHAADHLCQTFDSAGIERAHVMGTSFGGMVAQHFARRYPERASSLIACMCVPVFDTAVPAPGLTLRLMRLGFRFKRWPEWCRHFASQASIDPKVVTRIEAEVAAHSASVRDAIWEAMTHGCRRNPDYWFACPVAQVTAQRDDRFPGAQAAMKRMATKIPAELRIELAGVGHSAWYEAPSLFAATVIQLLGRLERGCSPNALLPLPAIPDSEEFVRAIH